MTMTRSARVERELRQLEQPMRAPLFESRRAREERERREEERKARIWAIVEEKRRRDEWEQGRLMRWVTGAVVVLTAVAICALVVLYQFGIPGLPG